MRRYQPSLGIALTTEQVPGTARPPLVFEPPWPLVHEPEIWIATVGPPSWGGAQVLMSEDDDDYRHYVGQLSREMMVGELLDSIPAAPAHEVYAPSSFRVRWYGAPEWPSATPATAIARRTDCWVGDTTTGEVVATTGTRLVEAIHGDHVYACHGPLIRSGYGTGRLPDWSLRAHPVGTPIVRLTREVFRVAVLARHVGQRLWFKLAAQNVYADPEAVEEPHGVTPVSILVMGRAYERDPRRWLT